MKKTINTLFLVSLGAVLIVMIVYNYYERLKTKEKNNAQTQKARETRMAKMNVVETDDLSEAISVGS